LLAVVVVEKVATGVVAVQVDLFADHQLYVLLIHTQSPLVVVVLALVRVMLAPMDQIPLLLELELLYLQLVVAVGQKVVLQLRVVDLAAVLSTAL
jgi:hypothetical protein